MTGMEDEHEYGFDPEVKRYFRKIINSFSIGLLWMFVMATAGLYFGLALTNGEVHWYNILFYIFFVATLLLMLWYLYKIWK